MNNTLMLEECKAKAKILRNLLGECDECGTQLTVESGKWVCSGCKVIENLRSMVQANKARNLSNPCVSCYGAGWVASFAVSGFDPCDECMGTGNQAMTHGALKRTIWKAVQRTVMTADSVRKYHESERACATARGYEKHEDDYLDMKDEAAE